MKLWCLPAEEQKIPIINSNWKNDGFSGLSSGNKNTVVLQHLLETQKRAERSNPIHLHELFFVVQHHHPLKVLTCWSPSLTWGSKTEIGTGRVFMRSYKDIISFLSVTNKQIFFCFFPFLPFPAVVKLTVICNQYITGANKLLYLLALNPEATTACP